MFLAVSISYLFFGLGMSVFGTLGNLFVLGAVLVHKALHHSRSVFLVNLAVADLIVTSIADPFGVVGEASFSPSSSWFDPSLSNSFAGCVNFYAFAVVYTCKNVTNDALLLCFDTSLFWETKNQWKLRFSTTTGVETGKNWNCHIPVCRWLFKEFFVMCEVWKAIFMVKCLTGKPFSWHYRQRNSLCTSTWRRLSYQATKNNSVQDNTIGYFCAYIWWHHVVRKHACTPCKCIWFATAWAVTKSWNTGRMTWYSCNPLEFLSPLYRVHALLFLNVIWKASNVFELLKLIFLKSTWRWKLYLCSLHGNLQETGLSQGIARWLGPLHVHSKPDWEQAARASKLSLVSGVPILFVIEIRVLCTLHTHAVALFSRRFFVGLHSFIFCPEHWKQFVQSQGLASFLFQGVSMIYNSNNNLVHRKDPPFVNNWTKFQSTIAYTCIPEIPSPSKGLFSIKPLRSFWKKKIWADRHGSQDKSAKCIRPVLHAEPVTGK